MARITATERRRIGRVRPELYAGALAIVDGWNAVSRKVIFVPDDGGGRSHARQVELYNFSLDEGGGVLAYPVATPGNSFHEYGAGIDFKIVDGTDADYAQLADIIEANGLRAGYRFGDKYHAELNETLEQARARWQAMVTAGIWKAAALALVLAYVVGQL